jgi:hypothetical protein
MPFFAHAKTSEDTYEDGRSIITLRDPNRKFETRIPTKERIMRPPPMPQINQGF